MSYGTYFVLFFVAFGFDLIYTVWTRAVANDQKLLAVAMSALMPLVGLVELICLIEAPGIMERIMVGIVTASGCGAATAAVLYWPRRESG